MKLYSSNDTYKLYHGSMLDMLEEISDNSIDSIVTDPPYELGFMNKGWDSSGVAFRKETWQKCYQVLKPGGYLLAFGGSRTFHRIACAIEDAGFEIRDTIIWLYGSGFPKSMNIGLAIDKKNGVESEVIGTGKSGSADTHTRTMTSITNNGVEVFGGEYDIKQAQNEWSGWGTALKPAYEPIIVARKPCEGTCIDNVLTYGVGGLNIDECRVDFVDNKDYAVTANKNQHEKFGTKPMTGNTVYGDYSMVQPKNYESNGRFPANVILTYDKSDEQEVCGGMPITSSNGGATTMPDLRDVGKKSKDAIGIDKLSFGQVSNAERKMCNYVAPMDSGSAARYFYCAKASKKDRDEGLDSFPEQQKYYCDGSANSLEIFGSTDGGRGPLKNIHPTVKPTTLMQYLVRLVTPNGGTILDPFNGSGSTGKAVMYENVEKHKDYKYIGIELTEQYLPIAKARIEYAETGALADILETYYVEDKETKTQVKMTATPLF